MARAEHQHNKQCTEKGWHVHQHKHCAQAELGPSSQIDNTVKYVRCSDHTNTQINALPYTTRHFGGMPCGQMGSALQQPHAIS